MEVAGGAVQVTAAAAGRLADATGEPVV